jgi:hypothetical protein
MYIYDKNQSHAPAHVILSANPCKKSKHILASMIYFLSNLSNKTYKSEIVFYNKTLFIITVYSLMTMFIINR